MRFFLTVSEVIDENYIGNGVSNIVTILQNEKGNTIFRRSILRSTIDKELWCGLHSAWLNGVNRVEYLGETLDTIEE